MSPGILEALIAAAAGAAAVGVPVMSFLIRLESRLTRLETTIEERLPAPKFNAPQSK